MVVTVHPPDLKEFFETVFAGMPDGEHILLARQNSRDGGFHNVPWGGKACLRWFLSNIPGAIYFNISTVRAPEGEDCWRRRMQDCVAAYVVVFDDIGTKVSEHPPVEPSYKIETSQGNYQWGYIIGPYEKLERYAQIVEALGELGFTDKGAGGYNRLMRIPGSVNIKPNRNGFVSTVTEWEPKRIFDLEKLATDLGVDLNALGTGKRTTVRAIEAGATVDDEVDPLLAWLIDHNHVVGNPSADFVTINCPWAAGHTTGASVANYSPLGRGEGSWTETRAFKCFHEHCQDNHFPEFSNWVVAHGGPLCMGMDPLPFLQSRYVYVVDGATVVDLIQRPRGGTWRYSLEDWGKRYYRMIPTPDRDTPVLIKTAFLESAATRKLDIFAYVPNGGDITELHGQPVVNTYVKPTHLETDQQPEIFLEHTAYLLGEHQDLFLDWLAYKIQNPAKRSYAIVMVAAEFGTGRSWIRAMLDRVLQGKVNTASLGQLIGKGTSGENNFNDWAAECQFLVIEEAKDNMDPSDFYKGYETFKQRVDTRPVAFRCNPKYGKTRDDFMYFNCLIFTNHSDAMIIPEGERRICVLENPSERKNYAYYDRLEAALDSDEPQKVYWYLKHRDVSEFDHVYPPDTEAKLKMIEQSKSPMDEVMEMALENLSGDIITKKILSQKIRKAARELEYPKIEAEPGGVGGRLWRSLGKLRLDEKNGARYLIEESRQEVRCIRNTEKWRAVDEQRELDPIVAELKKNMDGVSSGSVFPQK